VSKPGVLLQARILSGVLSRVTLAGETLTSPVRQPCQVAHSTRADSCGGVLATAPSTPLHWRRREDVEFYQLFWQHRPPSATSACASTELRAPLASISSLPRCVGRSQQPRYPPPASAPKRLRLLHLDSDSDDHPPPLPLTPPRLSVSFAYHHARLSADNVLLPHTDGPALPSYSHHSLLTDAASYLLSHAAGSSPSPSRRRARCLRPRPDCASSQVSARQSPFYLHSALLLLHFSRLTQKISLSSPSSLHHLTHRQHSSCTSQWAS
jgi:hypothetical protein